MKQKTYNEDIKKMIVDLYHLGSQVRDLSSEYGISDVTISNGLNPTHLQKYQMARRLPQKKSMLFIKRASV
ncbi:hypothetical protein H5P36_11715 [Bacillus sp. APMAM]|nr:hypothetical protein [Bacillus sp. APMAM]RTZ55842.1 hypothetical protein EKO25_10960 [Bacillus sp. SAJ1]